MRRRKSDLGAAMAGAAEVLWWWGAAVGVWLLTLSSVNVPELSVAAACGLPCALAARAGRHAAAGRWRLRVRWAAWLLPLAASIPADAARLVPVVIGALAGNRDPGRLREIKLPAGEPPEVSAAQRATASITVSATPGTFVVDSDPEENTLMIHSLASGWPWLDRAVRR